MKKICEKKGIKWLNEYFEVDNHIILRISKEETKESYDVLIDYDDFERVSQGNWHVIIDRKNTHLKECPSIIYTKNINGKQYNYGIHQFILDTKYKNVIIDHINENRFDNRKNNLRIVDNTINSFNCKRKGYSYDKINNKYRASIKYKGVELKLGRYNTELEAETIYLKTCIVIGVDKISNYIQNRIKELKIIITEEDYKNKYIIRAIERFD